MSLSRPLPVHPLASHLTEKPDEIGLIHGKKDLGPAVPAHLVPGGTAARVHAAGGFIGIR